LVSDLSLFLKTARNFKTILTTLNEEIEINKIKNRKYIRMFRLKSIFTNKYLITGIVFVTWMTFFDRNDITLQLRRIHELNKLQKSEKLMSDQIADTREELGLLKTNPQTLEKYARERYMMKKDNEDLFIITSDSSSIR
jgi:cell division protein DivIC